jgi:hypothetical protein
MLGMVKDDARLFGEGRARSSAGVERSPEEKGHAGVAIEGPESAGSSSPKNAFSRWFAALGDAMR